MRVNLIAASTYAISGLSAGIAGVIVTSRVSTGRREHGIRSRSRSSRGSSSAGRRSSAAQGAIWRTVLGVLLLAMIGNGFNLLNVNPIYQQIFQGAIILAAVGVDAWSRRSA